MKPTLAAALLASVAVPACAQDFGATVDQMLIDQTPALFGFAAPLDASAEKSGDDYRTPDQSAADQILLADGLRAAYLTRNVGDHADMMALFPAENPTHLIVCIESDREEIAADGKLNPGVQTASRADGAVRTILRGTHDCDGIRTTPWGTILATEEEADGGAYEILIPLEIENVVILNHATGAVTDPAHVAKRAALPVVSREGLTITPEGVVYGGDELRPGSDGEVDSDGGAIYKFVPTTAWTGEAVTDLAASPLAEGSVYAMQVQCKEDEIQFGQGCETGNAARIAIEEPLKARNYAYVRGATGYYRPEDMHTDPLYDGDGLRFCWTNTQREKAQSYGEVMCAVDEAPMGIQTRNAEGDYAFTTVVTRFVEGDADFNSFDNLAFQPGTGILYVIEDHKNGDVWACLPDGADRDLQSNGCVKMLSVRDSSAEPTGFMFSDDGMTAYVNIQHSDDGHMELFDDFATDDLIMITGFDQ